MSKRSLHRDLYAELKDRGLTEYGATITSAEVHEILGIEMPETATKATYDKLSLLELAAIDYVRQNLLEQGKYIAGTATGYRVLLPSENAAQVDLYMSSADKKLTRALKLSRCTPAQPGTHPDQTEARILLKRHGTKDRA